MKKIISLALVFILVVSMGSFTFAKPFADWDKFDVETEFIPPGLQGKGLPPGLAKQNKIPNGWNKGDKPQFEERHQWREQNREIQDLEQLVTRVENYLEDLEANHEDFYNQYDDKDEIIYEILAILGEIEGLNNPTQVELNEYYNDLEDKLDELKTLVKEELGENKAKLENLKEVLNYILDEEDLLISQDNKIDSIIVDINDLLEGFVTDTEYEGILDDVDDIINFDDLLEAYIERVEDDIINDMKNNYDSDELDAVEEKIADFYDSEDEFDVDEADADEAYMELYWLVQDLEEDYDEALEFNYALEEIDMILAYMITEEDTTNDQADLIVDIQDDIDSLLEDKDDFVTEGQYENILEDINDIDDFDDILDNFIIRVEEYINDLDFDYTTQDPTPKALDDVEKKLEDLEEFYESEADEEYFELYELFKALEDDYDEFND